MHKYPRIALHPFAHRLKRVLHGLGTCGTRISQKSDIRKRSRCLVYVRVVMLHVDDDVFYLRAREQRGKRVINHLASSDNAVLLGQRRAEAGAAAARRNNGNAAEANARRFGQLTTLIDGNFAE